MGSLLLSETTADVLLHGGATEGSSLEVYLENFSVRGVGPDGRVVTGVKDVVITRWWSRLSVPRFVRQGNQGQEPLYGRLNFFFTSFLLYLGLGESCLDEYCTRVKQTKHWRVYFHSHLCNGLNHKQSEELYLPVRHTVLVTPDPRSGHGGSGDTGTHPEQPE